MIKKSKTEKKNLTGFNESASANAVFILTRVAKASDCANLVTH